MNTPSTIENGAPAGVPPPPAGSPLLEIAGRLRTQDNRITANPMFCVQKLVADTGYDPAYCDEKCWWHPGDLEVQYDTEPTGDGWEGPYGYKLRWEMVMVAFTEKGCEEYLERDGHNIRRVAHRGEVRIYVESFNRCPEMLAIRDWLLSLEND